MTQDPVLEEIRTRRDEYARQFNYDLRAMYLDLKEKQEQSERKDVVPVPRRIEPTEPTRLERCSVSAIAKPQAAFITHDS